MTFSAEPTLAGLKPFQRDTVEYVFSRFFDEHDPTDRFLVADEVGLGKTMVAAGIIAKLIERHLAEPERRIDVVYVCSNQAIANQNFSKLAIVGNTQRAVTDRITTLPLHVGGLTKRIPELDRAINVIPITPTTSLDLASGTGRADERALLWHVLGHHRLAGREFMNQPKVKKLFAVSANESRMRRERQRIADATIDPYLRNAFIDDVRSQKFNGRSVRREMKRLVALDRRRSADKQAYTQGQRELFGQLRSTLAKSCIDSLEPDLVILDEFQRFTDLFKTDNPAGELADLLFSFPDCKTLLLSATPYKMHARAHELGEDHHDDFMETTGFLLGSTKKTEETREALGDFRRALVRIGQDGPDPAIAASRRVEANLKRVMCRTERLGAGGDRNGMLDPRPAARITPSVTTTDLRAYRELDAVAHRLGASDVVEYWKSAAYPLNLMDDYKLSREFEALSAREPVALAHCLREDQLADGATLNAGNARLRGLIEQLEAEHAWRCLWLPPSLPYYKPAAPFDRAGLVTKRLIFSTWQVVPKSIAAVTSHRASHSLYNRIGSDSGGPTSPLTWRDSMTELACIGPFQRLADLTDPLSLAQGIAGFADGELPTANALRNEATRLVRTAVAALGLPRERPGRVDRRWYVVVAALLDSAQYGDRSLQWLAEDGLAPEDSNDSTTGVTHTRGWGSHVRELRALLEDNSDLGAWPRDLEETLAIIGLAGPGCCALRALGRDEADPLNALRLADGLRRMFNLPESAAAVRGVSARRRDGRASDLWRGVLKYCLAGNLQAVLDEYVHVLRDWASPTNEGVVARAVEALGVQAATLNARRINADGRIDDKPFAFRSRFALRLDQGRAEDAKSVNRVESVRAAFNSPFWPFVLATTSVGQEGLDFHLYSHAIVHWNLPHNPVDMEQREGRIHRYKNHAVRRNLAESRGSAALAAGTRNPWKHMFDGVEVADRGLVPFWVYPGNVKIERHVPAEPMSADLQRLNELTFLMGAYRLAFGQPRQDELLAVLANAGIDDSQAEALVLDLSPPTTGDVPLSGGAPRD